MHIVAEALATTDIHPDELRCMDIFIELKEENTGSMDGITYNNTFFPLSSKITNNIAMILAWQNGENPEGDHVGYKERYKKGQVRNKLGDCHNFAWMAATGSIDLQLSTKIISSSFLLPEHMKMTNLHEVASIHRLSPDEDIVTLESGDGIVESLNIEEFESRLLPGDIITLFHYHYHQHAHSFIYLGKPLDKTGELSDNSGRYLQRIGRGGHLSIVPLLKTMLYYPRMTYKSGMIPRYSKIYRSIQSDSLR